MGVLLTGKGFKWSKIVGCEANITGRGVMWAVEDTIRVGEGTVRAGQDF